MSLFHFVSGQLTTVDCRSCYIPTCTGSLSQIESSSRSPSQSTGVCTTKYLTDCYVPVSDIAGRQTALGTTSPAVCTTLSTYNTRPSVIVCRWNSLPLKLRDETENTSALTENTAFQTILVCSAHQRFFTTMRCINQHFTYLFT